MNSSDVPDWRNALVKWFDTNGKDYPWRRTTDPYEILVSELMLQQTQVQTVLAKGYYENWLRKFPDLATLAAAEESVILKAWEGLGYYNRARNLQKAAAFIMDQCRGQFPTSLEQILKLPGVGPYTAGAICSFAYNIPAPLVDGNVARVLSRALRFQDPIDTTAGKKFLWQQAERLTCLEFPRKYNSAIMELGQQICLKGNPHCSECPVAAWCQSRDQPDKVKLPVKQAKVKITTKQEQVVLLVNQDKVLLTRETGSQRRGLWRLPLLDGEADELEQIGEISYPITRYLVKMEIFGTRDQKKLTGIAKKTPRHLA